MNILLKSIGQVRANYLQTCRSLSTGLQIKSNCETESSTFKVFNYLINKEKLNFKIYILLNIGKLC